MFGQGVVQGHGCFNLCLATSTVCQRTSKTASGSFSRARNCFRQLQTVFALFRAGSNAFKRLTARKCPKLLNPLKQPRAGLKLPVALLDMR
eukprot:8380564-Alexandrium_andersonii.AAC.1